MTTEQVFNEDQADVFRELVNIAYGRAAGLLYQFTGAEIQLHVPEVAFFDYPGFVADVQRHLQTQMVVSQQNFSGRISGETFMLVSTDDAQTLTRLLHPHETLNDDQVLSTVFEIGNIITTASTQILSELSHVPIAFTSPVTEFYDAENLQALLAGIDYSQVMSISTFLDMPDNNVFAKIYYLFYRDAISLLADSLHV